MEKKHPERLPYTLIQEPRTSSVITPEVAAAIMQDPRTSGILAPGVLPPEVTAALIQEPRVSGAFTSGISAAAFMPARLSVSSASSPTVTVSSSSIQNINPAHSAGSSLVSDVNNGAQMTIIESHSNQSTVSTASSSKQQIPNITGRLPNVAATLIPMSQ